jgi:acylpyruvate hydrolase
MQLVVFERRERSEGHRGAGTRTEIGSMGAAALGFETLDAVRHGTRRLGAIVPSGAHAGVVVDLNRALAVKLAGEDAGAPECEADSLLPSDPLDFLRRLPLSLDAARATIGFASEALEGYDGPDLLGAEIAMPRREVRLAAPVQRPGKLIALSLGDPATAVPRLFLKAASALAGPEDEILLPAHSEPLDFHGELAAVIGRRARNLSQDEALDAIAGYCVGISVHPFQTGANADTVCWSGDTFAPLGPALVTTDEIPNPHDLRLRARLSGETLQSGHTKELPIRMPELISRLSATMTLEPGDVILSGAPLGGLVGVQDRAIRDGDILDVEIERVGRLAVYVRGAAARRPVSSE